ncbi:MAG: META domain-containing protein, partial [Flavobacteriaceae bacterium]|nr:META domain-containing protein [Flavobacteriaceae bacterium]
MKIKSILLLSFSYLLLSCGSTSTQTTTVNPHAAPHIEMHQELMDENKQNAFNENYAKEIAGTYLGLIPCADCEKISYKIQLHEDLTYNLTYSYIGKSNSPIKKSGKFSINKARLLIELDNASNNMNYLRKMPYGLLLLDKNGNEITGDLADKYQLLPMTETTENNELQGLQRILIKKQQKGIDFYAVGNEPFWSLDMDFEKVIYFKNLDGIEFNVPAVKPDMAMDTYVTRYRSVTESGEIIIQLNQTECTDSMSGQKFDYSVSIDLKTGEETDFTTYKGCGNYIPDYRLHDIWAIVEVDGIKINPTDFKKNAPRIEINLTKKNVFGTDGCNTFRGSIKVEKNSIYFGNLASTMMACMDNTEVSSKIGKTLSNSKLTFKFEN